MKSKKLASFVLVAVMAAGLTVGCSGKVETGGPSSDAKTDADFGVNAIGFPIVKEPIKLTFFAGKATSAPPNWNDLPVWKEYAKMTNIDVDFQLTPGKVWQKNETLRSRAASIRTRSIRRVFPAWTWRTTGPKAFSFR